MSGERPATQKWTDFFGGWNDVDDKAVKEMLARIEDRQAERDGNLARELAGIHARINLQGERLGRHSVRVRGAEEAGEEVESALNTGEHRFNELEQRLLTSEVARLDLEQRYADLTTAQRQSERALSELSRSEADRKRSVQGAVGVGGGGIVILELLSRLPWGEIGKWLAGLFM